MQKPKIKDYLAQLTEKAEEIRQETLQTVGATPDRVIQELACIAFADPKNYIDEKGDAIQVTRLTEDARRALKSWNVVSGRYALYDKPTALKQLADALGMTKLVHEHHHNLAELTDEELRRELERYEAEQASILETRQAHSPETLQ